MKKTVAFLLLALVARQAMADGTYLYWTIEKNDYDGGVPFEYAKIYGSNGSGKSGYLAFADDVSQTEFYSNRLGGLASEADGLSLSEPTWAALGLDMGSDWKFQVQLFDENDRLVGWQLGTVSYDELLPYLVTEGWGNTPSAGAWGATVVPEPSGGLLLLLGMVGLALRRKEQV